MQLTSKISAIVAAFATLALIGGCGQRGPLYLPKIPPPAAETVPASPNSGSVPAIDTPTPNPSS